MIRARLITFAARPLGVLLLSIAACMLAYGLLSLVGAWCS